MSPNGMPAWSRVLVVVAHPDDESFGLGGVIAAFVAGGSAVHVHCLTRGEASTLGADTESGAAVDLGPVRAQELAAAAAILGVASTHLSDWPDGRLAELSGAERSRAELDTEVGAAVARHDPQGLLVMDSSGVTGHPDHVAATRAALRVAGRHGIPVLGWTLPAAVAAQVNAEHGSALVGHPAEQIDLVVTVDRRTQLAAAAAHVSQAVPGSILWRRLELLGDAEHLRWLTD